MGNVYWGTLRVLVRTKMIFIWALAFPLILSTLFMFMFANLDDADSFKPVPTAVVDNANYRDASAFESVIDDLAEQDGDQLLDVRLASSEDEAESLLAEGAVDGILNADAEGTPSLVVSSGVSASSYSVINQTILKTVVDTYLRNADLLSRIAADDPRALADADAVARALDHPRATEQAMLTHSKPVQSVRYYYALLGMAALFASNVGLFAINAAQPNLSPLGARRAVGSLSRGKLLAATLLASWTLAFFCLALAYAYIRLVIGIDFAGRDGWCLLALAIAALFATALGTLAGALPKLNLGAKSGMLTGFTCMLSLFAGLYGQPAMELADSVARAFPALASANPAKVITDLFYSLYYYDSIVPFGQKACLLLGMGVVLFVLSTVFIRRQRYASI